jgi:hypothetical protein
MKNIKARQVYLGAIVLCALFYVSNATPVVVQQENSTVEHYIELDENQFFYGQKEVQADLTRRLGI